MREKRVRVCSCDMLFPRPAGTQPPAHHHRGTTTYAPSPCPRVQSLHLTENSMLRHHVPGAAPLHEHHAYASAHAPMPPGYRKHRGHGHRCRGSKRTLCFSLCSPVLPLLEMQKILGWTAALESTGNHSRAPALWASNQFSFARCSISISRGSLSTRRLGP